MSDRDPEAFDAIVIGSGQGGVPLAQAFAAAGKRTAILERDTVGGTCVNYGCTPTKTLVHIAKVADTVRRAGQYGVQCSAPTMDMQKVRSLKRGIVDEFRDGTQRSLEKTRNLELIFGQAGFAAERTVKVKEQLLTAPIVVINTGGRPAIPAIPGLKDVPYLDNASIMELDNLPERLAVLGAGYIGLEFAQMYRRLGSEVTVIEVASRFLPMEDRDVADEILKILKDDGITFRIGETVKGADVRNGKPTIVFEYDVVQAEALLVATGRRPNTEDLNLTVAGIETDEHGYVKVDPRLKTTAEGVYAIGDVKGGPAFTHISYDDYRVLAENLLHNGKRSYTDRLVPYAVFVDPELGRVGLSEDQARRKGVEFKLAKMPMTDVARADEMRETRGFVKALVGVDGKILGAAVLGVEGGEIMSMIELAMMGGLTARHLKEGVFAHPTLSELLNNLFANF